MAGDIGTLKGKTTAPLKIRTWSYPSAECPHHGLHSVVVFPEKSSAFSDTLRHPRYLWGFAKYDMAYRRREPICSFSWHSGSSCKFKYLCGNHILWEQTDWLTEAQILPKCVHPVLHPKQWIYSYFPPVSSCHVTPSQPWRSFYRESMWRGGTFLAWGPFWSLLYAALQLLPMCLLPGYGKDSVPIYVKSDIKSDSPFRKMFCSRWKCVIPPRWIFMLRNLDFCRHGFLYSINCNRKCIHNSR